MNKHDYRPDVYIIMNRFVTIVWLFLILAGSPSFAASFTGRVVGISDGDTITVLQFGKPQTVHLAGIDCPEKEQAFGRKAKHFTSVMVFGEVVTVKVKHVDRSGRIAGEVILADGRNLNRELLREGLAWWYRRVSPDDFALGQLEKSAREVKIGLWEDENPIPPWKFRKK